MPFKSLSARMLSMFIAQFSLMLRLLAIAMTFTTDTFGCERLISLVNDLQTVFQSRKRWDGKKFRPTYPLRRDRFLPKSWA